MARRDTPVFVCDAASCKSSCTLSPTVSDDKLTSELTARGWLVTDDGRQFCPGCKADIAAEPTDTE